MWIKLVVTMAIAALNGISPEKAEKVKDIAKRLHDVLKTVWPEFCNEG